MLGSLDPARGVFQRLGRSVAGDKAAQLFNGKVTLLTKLKKIKDGTIKGLMVISAEDLVSILLFIQADSTADLTSSGTAVSVLVGAGSSDPNNYQVLAVAQAHVLSSMLIPVLASLYSECEAELEDSSALAKFHKGEEFVVSAGHPFEGNLEDGEAYFLCLLPIGSALAPGTTPPRGPIGDDLYSTIAQGGQPELSFVVKAYKAYTPAEAKTLQELAVDNKQALGKSFPPVHQGTPLVSSYITNVESADCPRIQRDLATAAAACLGAKKATQHQ